EPFWSACEDLELPLLTHSGGGERPASTAGPGGQAIWSHETRWMSRRALWQMIFGEVFERHPKLKLVFTEQRVDWMPLEVAGLDSIALDPLHTSRDFSLPRLPSAYWYDHCYICASFMAPFEAELRDVVGVQNLLWGSDYPHAESTWPHTRLAIRHALHDVPEA